VYRTTDDDAEPQAEHRVDADQDADVEEVLVGPEPEGREAGEQDRELQRTAAPDGPGRARHLRSSEGAH